MKHLSLLERRIQDLERRTENQQRSGDISDVKFDEDKQRWYIKITDGEGEEAFKSDWLPWGSQVHGSIGESMPPRKKQKASMISPNGDSEMAYSTPYHSSPDNPTPHGKPDQFARVIETAEDDDDIKDGNQGSAGQNGGQQQKKDKFHNWKVESDQEYHRIIQKKKDEGQGGQSQSQSGSSGQQQNDGKAKRKRVMPSVTDEGDDDTVQVKTDKGGHLITVGKKKAKIKVTGNDIAISFGEGASWKMSDKKIEVKIGDVSWTLDENGWRQEKGKIRHDDKNIGKDHKHINVKAGPDKTGDPDLA